jgi:hypothetical protein
MYTHARFEVKETIPVHRRQVLKTKFRCLPILIACMSVALAAFGASAQGVGKKNRPEISAGERALAMLEVQNTMSKHGFYHQVGQNCEELPDLWVKEDGPYAKTVKWTNTSGGVAEGMALIKQNYCTGHLESQKQALAELSKKNPAIKNIPENIGTGGEYVMHTQETPVIEVAGDGKTAKGMWYSIGLAVRATVAADGKTTIGTTWVWQKYAVDFVKEDGKWKMWHFLAIMDQAPLESGSGIPATYVWNPTVAPKINPRFPEPYYTFSETFSY